MIEQHSRCIGMDGVSNKYEYDSSNISKSYWSRNLHVL
jgi:hypothetical protein